MTLLPWNEINWNAPRPTETEMVESWTAIRWEHSPIDAPGLEAYLDAARAAFRGRCLAGRWRAVEYPDATAWFTTRNRHDEYGLHSQLLDSAVVRTDLAELEIPAALDRIPAGLKEEWAGALTLDGTLAALIVQGGPYDRFRGTAAQAKELASAAVHSLVGDRYEDFRVDYSGTAWTPWFWDETWDHTYVITDNGRAEVTVLCLTDTD
ncbi:hypothetical protein L1785_12170 [Antribacter sp. KLBMP9083]|uniref:Uncharacterized protein n=1 Tax=Antribacter soli TaxID=2910976 RepID=A0AA41UC46_9MICO|nr:hypothetical protein [Antribacter soli]MCF4121739.1 hypothetical protein [Antribacter soli]